MVTLGKSAQKRSRKEASQQEKESRLHHLQCWRKTIQLLLLNLLLILVVNFHFMSLGFGQSTSKRMKEPFQQLIAKPSQKTKSESFLDPQNMFYTWSTLGILNGNCRRGNCKILSRQSRVSVLRCGLFLNQNNTKVVLRSFVA